MHDKHIQATTPLLLALILLVFSPQGFSAPSEPNAVIEAAGEGLARLDVRLRPKGGKESFRFEFKGAEGLIAGGITLPGDSGSDYEITAFNREGIATYSGKGSIPPLLDGDRPLQLPLPPADLEAGRSDGIVVHLSRERLMLETARLEEPDHYLVQLQVLDPRGNPLKRDPDGVRWGITDPTHFELLPLKDRHDAVILRPREDGTILTPIGNLCDVPARVVLCLPDLHCRVVSVCADPWVSISAGNSHTCALKLSGAAYCWGSNNLGELGAPNFETCIGLFGGKCSTRPLRVECPTGAPCRFTQIAAGNEFTVAIDSNGDTWSWGAGAVAHKRVSAANAGRPVWFESITAGDGHGCGIAGGGEVWCWGANGFGQAGAPLPMVNVPFQSAVRVPVPIKFAKVVAAGQHTCALSSAGNDIACWGRDDQNQTSGPSSTQFPYPNGPFFFQHFGGLTPILDVAVSSDSSCVTLGNGNGVNCWGKHSSLSLMPLGTPEYLAAGHGHLCTILNQQASCLGVNVSGQLGIGSLQGQAAPVAPNTPVLFSSISAGAAHTCGISLSGDALCWGRALEGQIGNGAFNWSVWEPVLVTTP
jgi:alpha-tubulin suppressor-like RCC1 family protein